MKRHRGNTDRRRQATMSVLSWDMGLFTPPHTTIVFCQPYNVKTQQVNTDTSDQEMVRHVGAQRNEGWRNRIGSILDQDHARGRAKKAREEGVREREDGRDERGREGETESKLVNRMELGKENGVGDEGDDDRRR